ncbi:conserved hypothetical protein [Vibrio chagasii]|nr:conserved hypothetical protein [Vibrio chagasii]CAH6870970.1 conserved hypothetical protein [Vibrio chagasii]CAH6875432.1 conserved hypothetical protein [Vibrio chagasii]CAH7143754.1 conserved hypothetical protein [Vibrio chagasii]CAH7198211.1 conserved hypothetical protein [Vibrio chagasii]
MDNSLVLVTLNEEQISRAKLVNGQRKKITHVLLCGNYGQIFGTEKQCSKYYNAWKKLFKDLFSESKTVQSCDVLHYESTFNLVNILFAAYDEQKQVNNKLNTTKNHSYQKVENLSFWGRILGWLRS